MKATVYFISDNFMTYRPAANVVTDCDESVWTLLQNGASPWSGTKFVECLTDSPRSMRIGDVIVWEDGRQMVFGEFGFKPAPKFKIPHEK